MFNCHKHLKAFHDDRVTLTNDEKQKMRDRRSANQKRLANGLEKAKGPKILRHVKQGSYAMHTMVQAEFDASDIDDGVVFAKADLVGPKGGEYTPLDAKNMVRDALDDGSFKTPPEVHTNCVRVFYDDGFTVDIPVYRAVGEEPNITYELASTTWKVADPEGVTNWFNTQVVDKSPDTTNGRQMRRVVKLLKGWTKSRKSWNLPSGFILSKLTDEVYYKDLALLDRDDQALLQVMEAILRRLQGSLVVRHPVVPGETITKSDKDANMVELRDRLGDAVKTLAVLRRSDCTELDALKALCDLFDTDYFDARIAELVEEGKKAGGKGGGGAPVVAVTAPTLPVVKKGGEGRYA
jgi:cyclic GMP-AMP synthase DncV-like protein